MIDINEVGVTAFIIAYFRALEQKQPCQLFDDPYAEWFLPDEMREKAKQFHALIPEAGEMIRYRICYFHDFLRREIQNGVKQVVTIGAGFDMRPVIFDTEGVTFYEVDQPAVMQYKRQVLEQHGIPPCTGVLCNYLEVNLAEKLAETGFDLGAPSLFIWEGNTMYLPPERIYEFLKQLCEGVASFHISFDYLSPKVINRTGGIEGVTRAADFFEHNLGAPWITGFDDVAVFAKNTDLAIFESGEMVDIGKKYAPEEAQNMEKFRGLYFYCALTQ